MVRDGGGNRERRLPPKYRRPDFPPWGDKCTWGGTLYTTQHTLIKDLTPSEEELFQSLGKHMRQYIKRSRKEALFEIRFFDSAASLKDQYFDACKKLYEKMFAQKGVDASFNQRLARLYLEDHALIIAMGFQDAVPVGFSAVIHDEYCARLWLAAFDFRDESADRQAVSRAHQRLDWELLLWCKAHGIREFDFGGVNSFDEPNGIAQFKMNFERENKVTYHNYLVPTNLIGRAALHYFLRK